MIGADYDAAYNALAKEEGRAAQTPKRPYVQPPPRPPAQLPVEPLPVARLVLPWRQRVERWHVRISLAAVLAFAYLTSACIIVVGLVVGYSLINLFRYL